MSGTIENTGTRANDAREENVTGSAPGFAVKSWQAACAVDGASRACGDCAFTFPLGAGCTAIVAVDVVGRGRSRAALAWKTANAITSVLKRGGFPAAALASANALLHSSTEKYPYAVAFCALVDSVLQNVVYASAGHDVAFALADDGRIRHLQPTAPMLGTLSPRHVQNAAFLLEAPETIVVATDGISKSHPAGSSEFFGAARTALCVGRSLRQGIHPARALIRAAFAYAGCRQAADSAAVVVRFDAEPEARERMDAGRLREEMSDRKSAVGIIHRALYKEWAGISVP